MSHFLHFDDRPLNASDFKKYLGASSRARWHCLESEDLTALSNLERIFWDHWPSPVPFRKSIDIDGSATSWQEIYASFQRLSLFEEIPEIALFRVNASIIKMHHLALMALGDILIRFDKAACFVFHFSAQDTFSRNFFFKWRQHFLKQSLVWINAQSIATPPQRQGTFGPKEDPELAAILTWISQAKRGSLNRIQKEAVKLSENKKVPQLRLIRVIQKTVLRHFYQNLSLVQLHAQEKILKTLLEWELRIKERGMEHSPIELRHVLLTLSYWLIQL